MNFGRSVKDIKKGSLVICPKCQSQIAKVRKYLKQGTIIDYQTFEWNQFPFRLENNELICKVCFDTSGTVVPWLRDGEIAEIRDLQILKKV